MVLLGREAVGTTTDFAGSNELDAWEFQAVATGVVTTISFYPKAIAGAGITTVELGIYADNGAVPGSLLGKATFTGFPSPGPFSVTLATGVAVTLGTSYWLAVNPHGGTLNWQGTAAGVYAGFTGQASMPASWPGVTAAGTNNAAIWAEDAPTVTYTKARMKARN